MRVYNSHVIFTIVGSVLAVASYLPYFRDIMRGTTKPHPFTWFVWGLINGIAFFAQLSKGAGAGVLITALTTLGCLIVAALAVARGEKRIVVLDWWCFVGALISLGAWQLTADPLVAIILIIVTDTLASIPTLRKSYLRPYEETVLTYFISAIEFVFAVLALDVVNPTTASYQIFLVVFNALLVVMLLIRRRQLGRVSRI